MNWLADLVDKFLHARFWAWEEGLDDEDGQILAAQRPNYDDLR
jgi:hypothetical protein